MENWIILARELLDRCCYGYKKFRVRRAQGLSRTYHFLQEGEGDIFPCRNNRQIQEHRNRWWDKIRPLAKFLHKYYCCKQDLDDCNHRRLSKTFQCALGLRLKLQGNKLEQMFELQVLYSGQSESLTQLHPTSLILQTPLTHCPSWHLVVKIRKELRIAHVAKFTKFSF